MEVLPEHMERVISWLEKQYRFAFLLIVMVGVCVRLPLLDSSFSLAEATQALESTRGWQQELISLKTAKEPVFGLLVHLLAYISHSEAWLRMASFVPAIASLGVVLVIARDRYGKIASLAAGAFLALSSFHVFYSQELRSFVLAAFFCSLAWLGYESWIEKPHQKAQVWAGVFVVATVLSWYSATMTLFWTPVFLMRTLIWKRKDLGRFLSGVIGAGLLYIPGIIRVFFQAQIEGQGVEWEPLGAPSALKFLPLTLVKFLVGQQPVDATLSQILLCGVPFLMVVIAVFFACKSSKNKVAHDFFSLVVIAFLPLALAGVSSLWTQFGTPKDLLFLLPVWAVFLGWIISRNVRWGTFILVLWFVYQGVGLVRYWTDPVLQRENWKGVIADIEHRFRSDQTGVIMAFDAPFAPWKWYSTISYPMVTTGAFPLQESEKVHEQLQPLLAMREILVFDYVRDLTDPYRVIDGTLERAGYREIAAIDGKQIGFIRVFTQNRMYAWRTP